MSEQQKLSHLSDKELQALFKSTEQQIAEFNNTQMALKILLNGGYGALSNQFNRWYSDDIAESITLSGQLAARWIIQHLNRYFNNRYGTEDVDYIVATDTDSVHINVEPAVRAHFGDRIPDHAEFMEYSVGLIDELDKVITDGYNQLSYELNVFEAAMHMKFEAVSRAIWTGKKHYVMEIWAGEGGIKYDPSKHKIVGLEAVKSSTPAICRKWMKELFPLCLSNEEAKVKQYIEDHREQFYALPFEQVAFPRSINDIDKYEDPVTIYGKKCPPHVRGALLYNHLVKSKHLTNEIPLIGSGEKIRWCYMKLPNPLNENVFTCPDLMPEALSMKDYIDYQLQYEKTFVEPVMHVINAAKLNMSESIDISQFFS